MIARKGLEWFGPFVYFCSRARRVKMAVSASRALDWSRRSSKSKRASIWRLRVVSMAVILGRPKPPVIEALRPLCWPFWQRQDIESRTFERELADTRAIHCNSESLDTLSDLIG